jgi:enoyl-[acyl-carrier protein] reductase III
MNHKAARDTAAEIENIGVPVTKISIEVSKEALLREMFDEIKNRFGRLDVFISNAARTAFRSVGELNSRNWQRIMDINARAFLLCSQMAAELMSKSSGGKIIGISSLGASYYIPGYVGLGTAKAAIECLARYLAVEFAPKNINVNVVCGGFIDTESMGLLPGYKEMKEHIVSRTPAGRVGQPEDLAGVVSFLCSPEADWIRGQTIIVDGGFSLIQ